MTSTTRLVRAGGAAQSTSALISVAALLLGVGCGSNSDTGTGDDGGGGGVDSGHGVDSGGSKGDSGTKKDSGGNPGNDSGSGDDDGGVVVPPPPATCGGPASDSPATPLDFSNNLLASPSPPGDLTPQNAPQIVVFGWDDIESAAAITFLNSLLQGIKNPNGSPASCTVNPNSCYGEGYNQTAMYACGDGSLAAARSTVLSAGYELGNHTFDHLENYQHQQASGTWTGPDSWPGIPAKYKDATNGGWAFDPTTTLGPGVSIDEATWKTVIQSNDTELKKIYGTASTTIRGFRAPRLEINDNGLNAMKSVGYQYDQDLEETLPDGFVDAAVNADTDGAKAGINWFAWPYTLDNGSPGVWTQQTGGDASYVQNFPIGLWEVPVYEVYVPAKDGTTIATQMAAADKDCILPTTNAPPGPGEHCYLSDGEALPGSSIKEITGFDFNVFVYARMTPDQWTDTMKHTFLLHYYGDRAPVTYGAHPVEYTQPYDDYTLETQANNYGYRDVIKYSTYDKRQAALINFVKWIASDPALSKDTYFMSAGQLVDYMKKPFDKTGKAVAADAVASPDSNGLFTRASWTSSGATLKANSGNSATITFAVKNTDDSVNVAAGITQGALAGVSHIDIKYTSQVPFRIRLLTSDGSPEMTVLLGGVGQDRTARIRIKDFFLPPDASAAQVAKAVQVDATYMAKVSGIAFESAANQVTGAKTFTTTIEQLTLHGVDTSALCK